MLVFLCHLLIKCVDKVPCLVSSRLVLSCRVLFLSFLVWSLWSSWGSFWVIFGRLGGRFGLLGRSWGALGRSWRLLERSWGELTVRRGAPQKSRALLSRFLDPSWAPKGSQDGAQDETRRPQDDPRGSQDESKTNKNRSQNCLKKRSRFRTVLRPSWGDLGPILAPSWDPRKVKIVLSP